LADEHRLPDTDALIRRVMEIVNNAKPLPMSTTVRITKEEVLELLEEALERFPEEVRQARWMLKERAEFLARTEREGAEILEAARIRAERMVQRTEIVREADRAARRLIDDATGESARLRLEAEDYCDQKLAAFEIVLEKTMRTVQGGREKLRVTPLPTGPDGALGLGDGMGEGGSVVQPDAFFDQDRG
jgi:regulator of protease activity HflC (stomatin/prohibitin superfamily)